MPSVAIVAIKAIPAKMPAVELLLPVWGNVALELESLSAFDDLTEFSPLWKTKRYVGFPHILNINYLLIFGISYFRKVKNV